MKKVLLLTLLIFFAACTVCSTEKAIAFNIGTYQAETEYGLIDGFKFNFGKKKEGEKFIEVKSETPEEIKRLEREKINPPKKSESYEYEIYRFIQQNTVPF